MQYALGLIETVGYATAVSAADAALKAANVTLLGVERIIGVGGALGVTIQLGGDVGAVKSAVEAGEMEAKRVGRVISAHVIPRSHSEVNDKLLPFFSIKPEGKRSNSDVKTGGKKKEEKEEPDNQKEE